MPYIGKSPDLNASVDTNELADGSVTVSKLSLVHLSQKRLVHQLVHHFILEEHQH